MNIKIFVVFHKILDEIIFSNFTPEEMNKWFIRYGVNQKHPKSIIRIDGQKHDISNKRMKDVILEYNCQIIMQTYKNVVSWKPLVMYMS